MRTAIAAMIVLAAAAASGESKPKHHKHKHGSACGVNGVNKCPEDDYCKVESGCPSDANRGKCTPAPEMCAQDCPGVTGCDGKDYCNACIAEQHGTSAAPPPATPGKCKTAADCHGILPQICKVCGDGKEQCAHFACVAGECKTEICAPGAAGAACLANADCAAPLFCNASGACPALGKPGACAARPQICPRIFKQVCGCDGKTYSNGCEANSAGAAVAHDGPCAPPPKPNP